MSDEFFEEDEPKEKVFAAYESGEKGLTSNETIYRSAFIATIKLARHGESCKQCLIAALDRYSPTHLDRIDANTIRHSLDGYCDEFKVLTAQVTTAMNLLDDDTRDELVRLVND